MNKLIIKSVWKLFLQYLWMLEDILSNTNIYNFLKKKASPLARLTWSMKDKVPSA